MGREPGLVQGLVFIAHYPQNAPPRISIMNTRNPVIFTLILIALLATACSSGDQGRTVAPTVGSTAALEATPTAARVAQGHQPVPAGYPDIASVVERLAPAVVQVLVTTQEPNLFGQSAESASQGSGVIFHEDGYILTNNHVVENATRVRVVLSNHQRVDAEVVGTDPETDLAVLKIDPADVANLVVAKLGETKTMRIGDWVIAIGSPLGYEGTVTVGIVSAKGRSLVVDQNSSALRDLVQTDAVINPGNSGGPLLNLAGEVIGINTAIIRGSIGNNQEADGIGFSVSMDTAKPVAEQLITNGRVIRPRIGVSIVDVTPVNAEELGLSVDEGVLVLGLIPGGPADTVGVEVDDVIVMVDDHMVSSTTELVRLLLTSYELGQTVRLTVVRSAITLSYEVTLEEVS
jgi:serine protease Do